MTTVEGVLVNLRVLASLGDDCRIWVGPENKFTILGPESRLAGIYRWITGQTRHTNLAAVRETLEEARRLVDASAGMAPALRGACAGLLRIARTTYADDPRMAAEIQVLCDRVLDHVVAVEVVEAMPRVDRALRTMTSGRAEEPRPTDDAEPPPSPSR